ncbi:MAG: hypothetical protein AAGG55_03450 [Pseudomonadota bacterium]
MSSTVSLLRGLEICLEGFQGLEGLASQSDASAREMAMAMVPMNFELEDAIDRLKRELSPVTQGASGATNMYLVTNKQDQQKDSDSEQ